MTQETIHGLKEVRLILGQLAQQPDVTVAVAEKLLEMAYQLNGVMEDEARRIAKEGQAI